MQQVFQGHTGRIFSLALCSLADGTRIAASGSHDRTVRLWNLTTNEPMRTLQFSDFVWRVFLLVNGLKALVVAYISAEEKIHVCDIHTGSEVIVITGRLIFAGTIPTYKNPIIITATGDEDVLIVDAETGTHLRLIQSCFEKVFRAVVTQDIRHPILVFTTWNAQNRRSTIQTYDLSEEDLTEPLSKADSPVAIVGSHSKLNIVFEGDSRDGVTCVAVSNNISGSEKPIFCSGHYDFNVRVWDTLTRALLLVLEGHMDWVVSVALWKSVEPIVVSGSSDGTIRVWDLQTGALVTSCEGHQRDVWSVTVTHAPRPLIVSASSDRTVRTWDINNLIMNLKWERRKSFCLFLWCCQLLDRIPVKKISSNLILDMFAPVNAAAIDVQKIDYSCNSSTHTDYTADFENLELKNKDVVSSSYVSLPIITRISEAAFANSNSKHIHGYSGELANYMVFSNSKSNSPKSHRAEEVFMSVFLCQIIASFL